MIKSSGGVQQGDPLGPLLFSLVIKDLLEDMGPIENLNFQLWYLDDGMFVGSHSSVASLLFPEKRTFLAYISICQNVRFSGHQETTLSLNCHQIFFK